jgi:hypothetical protein
MRDRFVRPSVRAGACRGRRRHRRRRPSPRPRRRRRRRAAGARGRCALEEREAEQQRLQHRARAGALAEPTVGVELGDHAEHAHQVGWLESRGGFGESRLQVLARLDGIGAIEGGDEQRAQRVGEAAVELGEVVSVVDEALDEAEYAAVVAVGNDLEDLQVQLVADQPEHAAHVVVRDTVAREGEHLIEQRERVAHAAVGAAGDREQRVLVRLHPSEASTA